MLVIDGDKNISMATAELPNTFAEIDQVHLPSMVFARATHYNTIIWNPPLEYLFCRLSSHKRLSFRIADLKACASYSEPEGLGPGPSRIIVYLL